jgi:hypothetical protein
MEPPLIVDQDDSKWKLLSDVLKICDSRRVKLVMARSGLTPVDKAGVYTKIVLIAMYFSQDIAYVIRELEARKELRDFASIPEVPGTMAVSKFLSRFTAEQFIEMVLQVLNSVCKNRKRDKTVLADCTDITLDLNWFRRRIKKADLEDREFKWGYSPSKGYYIGMKLVLAVSYPSLKPLAFLIYEGSPGDAKIFEDIASELVRRRALRKGDTLVLDKGFYSYLNYVEGIAKFKIVPLIFPRKNFVLDRALGMISYPLEVFNGKSAYVEEKKRFFNSLVLEFKEKISRWKDFKPIRSIIEDLFKLAKNSFGLSKQHRYTMRSVKKACAFCVLLTGVVISLGINSKEDLQRLAEM